MGWKTAAFLLLTTVIASAIILAFKAELLNQHETATIAPADSPETPKRGFYMGILPIPADGQSFEEAYRQAAQYAEFTPVWGKPTPFYQLTEELAGPWGETFLEKYIRGNGMFPLICLSFIGENLSLIAPPDMEDASLSNQAWRELYKQSAINVVKAARPLYLAIGNEVNRWYEKHGASEEDPNGFQHFTSLYEEIYDAVKQISPKTRVFCIFAREIISENREADLNVLAMFNPEKMDLLVFTSYPYAVKGINNPLDIPNDYYSKAMSYFPNKPLGFSEIAWPSTPFFGGEEAQATFITEATGRLTKNQGINLHLFGWPWLHDLNESDHLGLIKRDGTQKLAYQTWKQLSTSGKD
ncbi:hypothetical protein H5T51_07575 [Candidatus Bathyarchaeota archaeon]|nr:hypothetical protein [Candidatus Bathyarchaeota archaeon]